MMILKQMVRQEEVSVASPLYFILHKFFGDRGDRVMEDLEANNSNS